MWKTHGGLNKETLERISDDKHRLSQRYKSNALKQAISIVSSTKKALKSTRKHTNNIPQFNGDLILDAKFISIEETELIDFDLIIRMSTLRKGKKIDLVTKKTNPFNKWKSFVGSKLIQGCSLNENQITVWFDIEDVSLKSTGNVIGVDLGVNKLITTSEKQFIGTDIKSLLTTIKTRKSNSISKKKSLKCRTNEFNRLINQLPWDTMKTLVVEDLHNLKHGKKQNRGKQFRKAIASWIYRQVLNRLEQKAQENRVLFVKVPPAYTSQVCPNCGTEHKDNRKGENFKCITCNHTDDADYIGASNILAKHLGNFRKLSGAYSPRSSKGYFSIKYLTLPLKCFFLFFYFFINFRMNFVYYQFNGFIW